MALSVGAFRATLGLDSSGFVTGSKQAESALGTLGVAVGTVAGSIATNLGGALLRLPGQLANIVDQSLNFAESVQNIASEADVTTETVQILGEALEDRGKSFDGAAAAIQRFGVRMGELRDGTGAAADELRELGLDPATFKSQDDALRQTIEALARLQDRTRASYLAGQLFERQYGRAIVDSVRAAGGSIGALADEYERLGSLVSSQDLDILAGADASIDKFKNQLQGLTRDIGIGFATGFNEGVSANGGAQLEKLGKDLREAAALFGSAAAEFLAGTREAILLLKEAKAGAETVVGPLTRKNRYGEETASPLTQNLVDAGYQIFTFGTPNAAFNVYGPGASRMNSGSGSTGRWSNQR